MVVVNISETYDLSTQVNKMGMVAIHTPTKTLISRLYPGFYQNYGKMKILGTSCVMACASTLPADPLQVGSSAGDIAPEDMFNPILYTAVSNDSFGTLQSRIYSLRTGTPEVSGPSVDSENSGVVPTMVDEFSLYYSLLSDADHWKKANPQAGLEMRNLVPLVFSIHSTLGAPTPNSAENVIPSWTPDPNNPAVGASVNINANYIRGNAVRMPSLPTTVYDASNSSGLPNCAAAFVDIPQTYQACIILPPSRLNKLYYRLVVTTSIEFTEPRSALQIMTLGNMANSSAYTYGSDYHTQSSKMTSIEGMADTSDADIKKVM